MRKHIDYYYKTYDRLEMNTLEEAANARFNEYGYNFDSQSRHNINQDLCAKKTSCRKIEEKRKKPKR